MTLAILGNGTLGKLTAEQLRVNHHSKWPKSYGPSTRSDQYPRLNGGHGKLVHENQRINTFKAGLFVDAPEVPQGQEALGGHTIQICNSMLQDGSPGDYGRSLPTTEVHKSPMGTGERIGQDTQVPLDILYFVRHAQKSRKAIAAEQSRIARAKNAAKAKRKSAR